VRTQLRVGHADRAGKRLVGKIAERVLLGFNYAFMTWPFRKMYMEAFGMGTSWTS
jgi:hypothetical protein